MAPPSLVCMPMAPNPCNFWFSLSFVQRAYFSPKRMVFDVPFWNLVGIRASPRRPIAVVLMKPLASQVEKVRSLPQYEVAPNDLPSKFGSSGVTRPRLSGLGSAGQMYVFTDTA